MSEYVEVWTASGPELVPLSEGRLTVGKAEGNDIVLRDDADSSRLHAVFENYRAGWSVRDMGSRNGTFVNGVRLVSERTLHAGDEIRIGETRLVFRTRDARSHATTTRTAEAPPEMTRREREVLVALCRPVLSGSLLTEPATVRDIAEELVVTESAVKKHLPQLYDKFNLYDGERRRGRLAAEAIRRGAVTLADLRSES